MRLLFLYLFFMCVFPTYGQQLRLLPLETNFRDAAFYSDSVFAPVFPISTDQAPVYDLLKDPQKRYATFGHYLYQRELLQVIRKEGSLWITPVLDLRMGIQRDDSTLLQYTNIRGVRIEGSMKNKVFFSGAFYENQANLPNYVRNYVLNRGEFYPNAADSSYQQVNAVIPGGARTKPFKINGFDYAYATGNLHYQILKNLAVSIGNTPAFIGSGYRSLIFSDNALPSMNFRIQYRIRKRWDFQLIRMQGLNMLRVPYQTNGESMYERKAFSLATVYVNITPKLKLGLIEGGAWYRGDSLQKKPVEGGFYIPLLGAATFQEAVNKKSYSYLGTEVSWRFWRMHLYGQVGGNLFTKKSEFAQVGFRIWPLQSMNLMIQGEYNHTGSKAYMSANPRIHYSNYNLPIGHPMAGNVDELVIRMRGDWKHLFFQTGTNFYLHQSKSSRQLLPVYEQIPTATKTVFYQQIDLGYSFNRTYGFEVFGSLIGRYDDTGVSSNKGLWIQVGVRTALNNHYFDF